MHVHEEKGQREQPMDNHDENSERELAAAGEAQILQAIQGPHRGDRLDIAMVLGDLHVRDPSSANTSGYCTLFGRFGRHLQTSSCESH
jgi:hypothetical protein